MERWTWIAMVGLALCGCTGDNPAFGATDTAESTGKDVTSETTGSPSSSNTSDGSDTVDSDTQSTTSTTVDTSDSDATGGSSGGVDGSTSYGGGTTGDVFVPPDLVVFEGPAVQGNFAEGQGNAAARAAELCVSVADKPCADGSATRAVIRVGDLLALDVYPTQWAEAPVFGPNGGMFAATLGQLVESHLDPSATLFSVGVGDSPDGRFWSGAFDDMSPNCQDWVFFEGEGIVGIYGATAGWFENQLTGCSEIRPLLCVCER